ncbi:hypothetical protein Pse7367_0445 [Thalassoporum mexicanum PCC 7367]|uniref:hypothetical protein n=1 Tax=Thalassoporum mexicanum TaxID=3457544 RepID=UPI00029FEEFA|nr:hypothetical protein [Pseudanabaena sp. PCC 7367]AFY68756.1 hypothetical protein Pse7367_0445 [Pseudanabaena sp. PCC 7367]
MKNLSIFASALCLYGLMATPIGNLAGIKTMPVAAQTVNGFNVKEVRYGQGGMFQQQPDGSWLEKNRDGQFTFQETNRDEWSVYLVKSDGARVQLDLFKKEIILNGSNKLYDILSSSATSSISQSSTPRNAATRTPTLPQNDANQPVSTEPLPGKQCVYNNGLYVLTVDWFDPATIIYTGGNTKDFSNYEMTEDPHSSENITLGYSSCTNVKNRVAVVRIVGHDIANEGIVIAAGAVTGIVTGAAGAFACVATAGTGCPAAAAVVGVATSAAVSATGLALPDIEEIAYLGSPGTEKYLDVSGTLWTVKTSQTVPLSRSRNAFLEDPIVRGAANFITDGDPGPKSITFNNQSGYVAKMTVIYHEYKDFGNGVIVTLPVVKSSGDLPLGFSRHVDIPENIADIPITVSITGTATIKSDIYSTTIPANFRGNKCFKTWATIFDAKAGTCN